MLLVQFISPAATHTLQLFGVSIMGQQKILEVIGLNVYRFDQSGHARHVLVLLLAVHPVEEIPKQKENKKIRG